METKHEEDLKTWVRSLDREVTTLGRAMSSMRSTVEASEERQARIEANVDKLLDIQSKPKPPFQLLGTIAVIATLLIAFGTFIELRMGPSEDLLFTNQMEIKQIREEGSSGGKAADATLIANVAHLNEQFKHLDFRFHENEKRLNASEVAAASTKKSTELLEAHVAAGAGEH